MKFFGLCTEFYDNWHVQFHSSLNMTYVCKKTIQGESNIATDLKKNWAKCTNVIKRKRFLKYLISFLIIIYFEQRD